MCVLEEMVREKREQKIYIEINKIRWTTCKREIVDENTYKLFAEEQKKNGKETQTKPNRMKMY